MKRTKLISLFLAVLMLLAVFSSGITATAALPFNDTEGHWATEAIEFVVDAGLMNGVGDGSSFAPNMSLTRGMVVTVLYRDNGSPKTDFKGTFLDVKEGQYYAAAAEWAYANGIVNGTGTNEWDEPYFSPDRDITRQELATMFKRYADFKYVDTTKKAADISAYPDVSSVADWANDAVKWAVGVGLITGKGTNGTVTLSPTDKAVRAEFATIIKRFKTTDFDYLHVYSAPKPQSHFTEPVRTLINDADVYVAVDGNDANPGTLAKPLATFEAAKAKVRQLKDSAKDGVVVAFKAGNYGNLNISFDKSDSGTESCPITYCVYGDGDVVFQNGIDLKGSDFKPIDSSDYYLFPEENHSKIRKMNVDGIITADALKRAIVMTDGNLMQSARWPNGTTMNTMVSKYADDALKFPEFLRERLESWHTLDGVTIEGQIIYDFEFSVFPVLTFDKTNLIMTFAMGDKVFPEDDAAYWSSKMHQFCNVSEELDTKYEFYLNADTMCLYVYGDVPADVYSISTGGQFISVGDGYNVGANYLTFDGFTFKYCTETAIRTSHVSKYVNLKNLSIYAVNGRGIHLNGDGCVVEGCEIDLFTGEGIFTFGSNLMVTNNLITNGYSGISASGVKEVSHNEIYNMEDSAIYYSDCPMIIEYNFMENCCMDGSDKGYIYNGASWFQVGGVIRYNVFSAPDGTAGMFIYLDDGLSNQEVYGNLFYGAASNGVRINGGRNNDVYENVFVKTDKHDGTMLSLGAKYVTMFDENGNPTGTLETYHANSLGNKPKPGTDEYKLWEEKWPEALKINTNWADIENDIDCGANPSYNVVINNYSFVGPRSDNHQVDEPYYSKFSTVENNPIFDNEENYLFVNPTLGNYTIIDDVDESKITKVPYIPYEMIGRH
ncbi:MAG: S-layer homology domain-containing protein [Clostridia bacterium]|nr:S-layer homology domain-containing protein [Clostridia bacterium]